MEFNWIAIIVAGLSAFPVGRLWYSKWLFGRAWLGAAKFEAEQPAAGNAAKTLASALACSIFIAAVFSAFIGPKPDMVSAVSAGALAGLCWVGGALGVLYFFERRSPMLLVINVGYATIQFMLYGVVLSLLG